MKYKIGDKVRIIDERKMISIYSGFSILQPHIKYCGKVMTIKEISSLFGDTEYYLMEEDNKTLAWSEKMIEELVVVDIETSIGHLRVNRKGLYTINWKEGD